MYKFCSTQVNLPILLEAEARRCIHAVPARMWARSDSRETNPHVTIRYGLVDVNPERIREVVRTLPPFEVKFGVVNFFPTREGVIAEGIPMYIEVKDSAGAGGLVNLRRRLEQFIDPAAHQFDKYEAHMTLGYVGFNSGATDLFKSQPCILTGKTMLVDSIVFCSQSGIQHECSLKSLGRNSLGLKETYQFYHERL